MRILWPDASGDAATDLSDTEIAAVYAYPTDQPSWLRANMISSIDGSATADGSSRPLSSPADQRILGILRALADVVVVGAGTARAENYRPARVRSSLVDARRTAGQSDAPTLALASSHLDLDPDSEMFQSSAAPTIVLTHDAAPAERHHALSEVAEVMVVGEKTIDWDIALAALAARGLRRQLCEGGPHLLGELITSDHVDEVALTVSAKLAGPGASRIVAGEDNDEHVLTSTTLTSVLVDHDTLFLRYVRSR